jgi:type IV secretory pathway protease TraF
MNSEAYWKACERFDKKEIISYRQVKKRWFRNYYVLYQSKGYFDHETFVLEFGKFEISSYSGRYYGPFLKSEAISFAAQVKSTHLNFVLGG